MQGYYPVLLDLKGKRCVVIGGGRVAERKTTSLIRAGAIVTVVSLDLTKPLQKMAATKKIHYLKDCFKKQHLQGALLVISAANNSDINRNVFNEAVKQNKLVNVVDSLEECNFIVPSTVKQGDLQISISTGGKSPALAKKIRKQLEKQFGKPYKDFLSLMGKLRRKVLAQFSDPKYRKKIFQAIVDSEILALFEKEQKQKAEDKAKAIINSFSKN